MFDNNEFRKYATKHQGISSLTLDYYVSAMGPQSSMTPYIIEERQLNISQLDVFSRLMMDRIIFMGTAINDQVANIIQAQLLFLESADPKKTSKFILIPQVDQFMLVWEFTIQCKLCNQMLLPYAQEWLLLWVLY